MELRSGPTSPPALLTAWQLMQFRSRGGRPPRRAPGRPWRRPRRPGRSSSAGRQRLDLGRRSPRRGPARRPAPDRPGRGHRRRGGRAWRRRRGSCCRSIAAARTAPPPLPVEERGHQRLEVGAARRPPPGSVPRRGPRRRPRPAGPARRPPSTGSPPAEPGPARSSIARPARLARRSPPGRRSPRLAAPRSTVARPGDLPQRARPPPRASTAPASRIAGSPSGRSGRRDPPDERRPACRDPSAGFRLAVERGLGQGVERLDPDGAGEASRRWPADRCNARSPAVPRLPIISMTVPWRASGTRPLLSSLTSGLSVACGSSGRRDARDTTAAPAATMADERSPQ